MACGRQCKRGWRFVSATTRKLLALSLVLAGTRGDGGDDGDDEMIGWRKGEEKDYEYSSTRTSCLFRTVPGFCFAGVVG